MCCSNTGEIYYKKNINNNINIQGENRIYFPMYPELYRPFSNNFNFPPVQVNSFNNAYFQPNIQEYPNKKNCYICGENFGQRYVILNSNGVSCCQCTKYSDFNKKFECINCNSEFCFKCGQQFHQRRNYNCYICGENFGQRYVILNSNGVSCCKCSRYSDFNKKFSCNNCNSEFCFSCGKN